jgi:methionyl-tRNA synthetase
MATKKFYITTAIDYVNAKPHIGHAFEKTLTDAIARYHRLKGEKVFFLTGVDENAQKNVQAAEVLGIPVKQFVDTNTKFFIELCKKLDISYDDFIRTSAQEHGIVVKKLIKEMMKRGDIYKSTYEGYYCTGCEAFKTEKELVNGKCPEHEREPEHRKEEAYFFRLSKYQKQLLKIIPEYVVPEQRKNEVLARVKDGLNDLCISRKNVEWGIDFPGDSEYKVYVWVDALINYVSGLKGKEKQYWPADVHVIGKGINWFHAVIWPALLLSAKYKLPKTLLVHGYLNSGGKKMSKSLGNVIDPLELANRYPSDSIRYSLLRCSVFDDSDYSEDILIERHNNELANKLGNLVSRVSALAEKNQLQKTPNTLIKKLKLKQIEKHMDNYELDKALSEIFAFIDVCNEYIQSKKPWEAKTKSEIANAKKVLYELSDSIKAISILLWPFIPNTSEKIAKNFNFKIEQKQISKQISKPLAVSKIKKADILFQKIEINKEEKLKTEQKEFKPKQTNKIEGVMTMSEVNYADWEKIELRVGKIINVEDIEGADKLYKLTVDVGSEIGKRTICAGIKQHYKKDDLKGKKIILFINLAPRMMRGIESQGMLLAAVNNDESKVILISPEKDIEIGSRVR